MKVDPATLVIERFGGIRQLAGKLSIEPSSVLHWRERGVVPSSRMPEILRLAQAHQVSLSAEELILGGDV